MHMTATQPDTRANPYIDPDWRNAYPELRAGRHPEQATRVMLVRQPPRSRRPHVGLAVTGAVLMVGCGALSAGAAPAIALTGIGCGLVTFVAGLLGGRLVR